MESKIIKTTKNPFLNREEIVIEINADVTPTKQEVVQAIGKDAELTVVKKINTNFGKQNFVAEAVIYDSAENKEKVEVIPKKIRKKMEAEKKAAEEARIKAEEEAKKAEEEAKAAEAEAKKAEEESTEEKAEEEAKEEAKE
jgi:ribosomal protein S24E